jgi:hypothetical protein
MHPAFVKLTLRTSKEPTWINLALVTELRRDESYTWVYLAVAPHDGGDIDAEFFDGGLACVRVTETPEQILELLR